MRPVLRAEVLMQAGEFVPVDFLVDSGADRTVFSANLLQSLEMPSEHSASALQGVGGRAESVIIPTKIRMKRETGAYVTFEAQFAAFTDPAALDMSVLGRDITNLFAMIVDRPQDTVCLLTAKHRYVIVEQ